MFFKASETQQREVMEYALLEVVKDSELSYREIGEKMGWSKGYVSQIVHQKRNLDFLDWVNLCSVLGILPKEFLDILEKHLV